MAQSVKIDFDVWSQFDYHAYNIMTEDFVHDHLFKVNANVLTEKGKARLVETYIQKEGKLSSCGEMNIWFPLVSNKSLYMQMKNKGFRLHFDNGLLAREHRLHNIYASIESNRKLNDFLFKVGCQTITEKWRYNLRYRYSSEDVDHTLYTRWRCDYENWTFEGIKALNLNNFILLKNNFLVGYYFGSKTFHVRLENDGWRTQPINLNKITIKDIFHHAIFNFTKTLNANSRLGIQATMKTSGLWKPFSFVWQTYDPVYHTTLKLKANTDMSAAFSIRNKIGTYGSYVLGIGLKDIGTHNTFKFGVLVDLNL